jgi:hypothetical protein
MPLPELRRPTAFVNKEPLVRITADWDCSRLLRQTPGGSGVWNGVRFTTADTQECDYLVMLNNRRLNAVTTCCPPEHVWAIMQEPYVPGLYDWLVEGHEPFARVYTHMAQSGQSKYIESHPAMPWEVGLSYDELIAAGIPPKTDGVSWIASNLSFLPGHRVRERLRSVLKVSGAPRVDMFGRGVRWIERKWDALGPYRYSLAIENSFGPHLWTEKIADCFLAWTVPLYCGCTNLDEYFPREAYIRLDAMDPDSVIRRLRQLETSDEWEQRLPALEEARRLVLEKYQIFPMLAEAVRQDTAPASERTKIVMPGYRWRRYRHRARYVWGKVRAGEAWDLANTFVNKVKYAAWFRA